MKILVFDIETLPIISYTWGIHDQNVALNQIKKDISIASWAAKWLGEKEIFYMDQRNAKDIRNDKKILKGIWKLLDECDVVLTQNGKSFDVKKLNARFVMSGMKPPSTFKHIDTLRIAKRVFGFTSNKLEFMTDKLCTRYKKLQHKKFPGFELWNECMNGNLKAWKAMEKYNKHDVLALEELYTKLAPWDTALNYMTYTLGTAPKCSCGSKKFKKRGFFYSPTGKFQRYRCRKCGAETRSRQNLLTKEEKRNLIAGTKR